MILKVYSVNWGDCPHFLAQIQKYGSWLVKILRKFIFTSKDLKEKTFLVYFQLLNCEGLYKS